MAMIKGKISHREKLRKARRMNGGLKSGAFQSDRWQDRREARAKRVARKEATQQAFARDRRVIAGSKAVSADS